MIGLHNVAVLVDGFQVGQWSKYSISCSMLTPSDSFTLTRPWDSYAWAICRPDSEVVVCVDGVPVITGWIDDRELSGDDDSFTITGRDKIGRLIQESSPAFTFAGLSPMQLIGKIAQPWFTVTVDNNERNRRIVRGKKGKIAQAGTVTVRRKRKTGSRVEPGQTKWTAIEEILKQTGEIAMSSGDGKELIVFAPNTAQEPQWNFFRPAPYTRRKNAPGQVQEMRERWSVGDLYSRIDVVGSGVGSANSYGVAVNARSGVAKDFTATADGEGDKLQRAKKLLLNESVRSLDEAREFAEREMSRRAMNYLRLDVVAPLHGQRVAGGRDVTLFALDTIAACENEMTGTSGPFRVVELEFTTSRADGEITRLGLIPEAQEIFL